MNAIKSSVRVLLPLLLSLLMTSTAAHSDERPAYRFVGTFFPYVLEQAMDGSARGLAVDVLERISELSGDRFEVQLLPWARALSMVRNGNADGIIGPYRTPQREQFIDFSEAEIYRDHMVFLTRSSDRKSTRPWNGRFDSISGQKIITVRSWAYGSGFEAARGRLEIIETNTFAQALQMLLRGRGDLLAANERNALFEIHRENMGNDLVILAPPFRTMVGYFGFSAAKADSALQRRFNKALRHLHSSGEMARLWRRHGLKTLHSRDQR